jgi:hypothetical protein
VISARVSIERGWGDRFARRIEQQVPGLLRAAAEEGAKVASDASRSRQRTGKMAKMEVLPARETPRGFQGGFRSRAWYAGFQSYGTKGQRNRRVSAATLRRRQSSSEQARQSSSLGISPLGFLEKGRTAMRRALIARLNRLRR